jgi:hydrogenase maturation protease
MMKTVIVIGYGNDLRSDDGIGQLIANTIKSWDLPNLKSLAVHQLTPELAANLANVNLAIFVDARINWESEDVQVESIVPAKSRITIGHTADARSLLALTQFLYNHFPPAWLVTVPGVNFELGDRISPIAEKGREITILKIREILHKCNYL